MGENFAIKICYVGIDHVIGLLNSLFQRLKDPEALGIDQVVGDVARNGLCNDDGLCFEVFMLDRAHDYDYDEASAHNKEGDDERDLRLESHGVSLRSDRRTNLCAERRSSS